MGDRRAAGSRSQSRRTVRRRLRLARAGGELVGGGTSVDGTTFRQWGSLAHDVATSLDLRAGDRVLVDTARHEHPYAWLLAPLSVGATVVLCANLDPATADTRAAAEHATRVL